MKLNKILLGCILFVCAANSGELKLESTTGGDYLTVKDGDCFVTGYDVSKTIITSSGQVITPSSDECDFSITAKEKVKILALMVNQNISKDSVDCKPDATQNYSKSTNTGPLEAGETRWYRIKCVNLKDKQGLQTITITTDKNKATYKNSRKYVNEDFLR